MLPALATDSSPRLITLPAASAAQKLARARFSPTSHPGGAVDLHNAVDYARKYSEAYLPTGWRGHVRSCRDRCAVRSGDLADGSSRRSSRRRAERQLWAPNQPARLGTLRVQIGLLGAASNGDPRVGAGPGHSGVLTAVRRSG
jgi:hypothetical protein